MIIKKFVGKTQEEALEAARKELGEGIVVMNVKQIKPKGLFAFLKQSQTEVTVAMEEERESEKLAKSEPEREAIAQVAKMVKQAEDQQLKEDASPKERSGHLDLHNSQNSIEQKLDSLQTLLESQLRQTEEEPKTASGLERLTSYQAKSDREPDEEQEEEKNEEQEKFVRLLYNTMIENEVDEKFANQILDDVEKNRKPNMPFDYILANIYQRIILKLDKSEGITPAGKGPKTVVFIGPTGVGKTTTIAKIASKFVMEDKKKVALLTTDTYRIAATEQLRTYAQILEVAFRVIYTEDEMREALDCFADYDYILVDTAGHSHKNEEQLSQMRKFIEVVQDKTETQSFLVLCASTKYKDLLKIADSYKTVADYQLIFTKLDETSTLGNMLNVKLHADTPIAYVTYGQNVPSDIERFNPQKTVKQLLGGKA